MNDPSDKPQDQSLSRLYRQAGTVEPPAALDAAILAAARKAVVPKSTATPWWRRLRAPVAVVATITLAIGLSLTVDRQPPQRADAPVSAVRPSEAPPPTLQSESKLEQALSKREQMVSREKVLRDTAPAAKQAQPTGKVSAQTVPEIAPPAAPLPAAPPAAPVAAPAALGATAESSPNTTDRSETRRASAAPSVQEAKRDSTPRKPAEAWLEEIRRLKQQGRDEDARRELDAFRQAYPDFRLPDDLR